MNHTPGPWTQDEYGSVKTPSGETLLVEGVALAGRSTEETRANTRLIAAADDLLAALKEVFIIGDELVKDVYGYEFVEKAQAAIKKAEGQS